MTADIQRFPVAVLLIIRKAAFFIALILLLCAWGKPTKAGMYYANEYQVPNGHYNVNPLLDRWFPSREAACRDIFDRHVAEDQE